MLMKDVSIQTDIQVFISMFDASELILHTCQTSLAYDTRTYMIIHVYYISGWARSGLAVHSRSGHSLSCAWAGPGMRKWVKRQLCKNRSHPTSEPNPNDYLLKHSQTLGESFDQLIYQSDLIEDYIDNYKYLVYIIHNAYYGLYTHWIHIDLPILWCLRPKKWCGDIRASRAGWHGCTAGSG